MKLLGLVLVAGCSSSSHGLADAAQNGRDSAIDAALDARPDAPADAPPDAASTSPRCATAPSILLATSPRVIGNMALAGDTLYVGAYQVNNSTVSDNALIAVDLQTGVASAPLAQVSQVALYAALGNVYMSEYRDDGTIWQIRPGNAPVALVEHLATPTVVTADSDYVYWATTGNAVQRRLIAGGPIESVMSCAGASRLIIDDADIYCAEGFQGYVIHAPKDGSGGPVEVTTTSTDYPIYSMIKDGAALYYANFDPMPDLLEIDPATSSASVIYKSPMPGRYSGLAATSDYFYLANYSLQRLQRSTHVIETIVSDIGIEYDPVIWNQRIYYETQDGNDSGERWVMQCVD